MAMQDMLVANLSNEQIALIKKYEQDYSAKFGDNVLLIALKDAKK